MLIPCSIKRVGRATLIQPRGSYLLEERDQRVGKFALGGAVFRFFGFVGDRLRGGRADGAGSNA